MKSGLVLSLKQEKNLQKNLFNPLTNGKIYGIIRTQKEGNSTKSDVLQETALHTRGISLTSHPPLLCDILKNEVTATNKVVTVNKAASISFIFFLPVRQVTLEAVPSIPAKFQQETPLHYCKLNIYHKVLLKLNKTLISTHSNFLLRKGH